MFFAFKEGTMKSKRLIQETTSTGIEVNFKKCRKCREDKRPKDYYNATDIFIDSDGLFSVCKSCINSMFDSYLESEKSVELAVLKICRSLNLKYDPQAIEGTISQLEEIKSAGKILPPFMGIYKLRMTSMLNIPMKDKKFVDLSYQEIIGITISNNNIIDALKDSPPEELIRFWGEKYSHEDLEFLEYELTGWKRDYSCSNKGEEFILKELCYKSLELKKARIENRGTDSILKSAQEIMKSGALTPAQANSLSEKNTSTFGVWLKDISELRPEEWVENKSIYRDVDNLEDYNERIFISPMRALTTGVKEFNVEAEENIEIEEGE